MRYGIGRLWFALIFVLALAIALPTFVAAVESLLPAVILFIVLIGIGALIYGRRRYWLAVKLIYGRFAFILVSLSDRCVSHGL